MKMSNAIEVTNLTKRYGEFCLDNISFNVESGTIMGFVGQNGAGKTTTIKSILNIIKTNGGSIKVFGLNNISDEIAIKENIGVVFDDICFNKTLNMRYINSIMKGIYKEWSQDKFYEYCRKFELPLGKKFKAYSRGMKMKASMAVALSHNAKLLILDEPTSGLDPIVRNEILDMLQDFVVSEEHTILFSSHITSDLGRIADAITFIHKGKVVFSENKIDLLERHAILKCSAEDFAQLDKQKVISSRKSSCGYEALISDREFYERNYPNLVIDNASIDDIMVFYAKEAV